MSGTSMAAPHVAGVAALTRQAHPKWKKVEDLKAAIVNTGDPAAVLGYRTSRGGSGFVQPVGSTKTNVVAIGDKLTATLNYGFEQLTSDFSKKKSIKLRNHGSSDVWFQVSATNAAGSPHTISLSDSLVKVRAGNDAEVDVRLTVPVATVGNADAFREVAGLITFTPVSGGNSGIALRVPYYLVPRALSRVDSKADDRRLTGPAPSTTVVVRNRGPIDGTADFYAWGLEDRKDRGKVSNDLRAIGVQSFPGTVVGGTAAERFLVFGVSVFDRWSNAATNEFDIFVDVDNDGTDDYVVVGVDVGAVTAGVSNGVMGSFVFSTRSAGASLIFNAFAPHDSTTLLLPILTRQLCRTGQPCLNATTQPRFTYSAVGFDRSEGGVDPIDGTAKFNAWTPSISNGMFETVTPGGAVSVPVSIDTAEWALTPAKGVMVITHDDKAGPDEADLVEIGLRTR